MKRKNTSTATLSLLERYIVRQLNEVIYTHF